jgi:hypothetical protein
LRAEAGEIANAIERILACDTYVLPKCFNPPIQAKAHPSANISLTANSMLRTCLAVGLPFRKTLQGTS